MGVDKFLQAQYNVSKKRLRGMDFWWTMASESGSD